MLHAAKTPEPVREEVGLVRLPLRVLGHQPSGLGGHDTPRKPVQQRRAAGGFQLDDLPAHRRGGDVQRLCGAAHRAGSHDGEEVAKRPVVHGRQVPAARQFDRDGTPRHDQHRFLALDDHLRHAPASKATRSARAPGATMPGPRPSTRAGTAVIGPAALRDPRRCEIEPIGGKLGAVDHAGHRGRDSSNRGRCRCRSRPGRRVPAAAGSAGSAARPARRRGSRRPPGAGPRRSGRAAGRRPPPARRRG